jgi:signal transduction histidine kinase/ligand-binding sensor domain-containing protein
MRANPRHSDQMRFTLQARPLPVLLLLASSLCSPLPCRAGRLPIRIYTTTQGLPRNFVTSMAAGQNGVMWFSTTEGLVRFDGHEFRVFGPEQGLPSRNVLSFTPSRSGGYWVLTDRGVCRLPAGSKIGDACRPVATAAPEEWRLGDVEESPTGEVWAASARHVFRIRPERAALEDIAFPLARGENVLAIAPGEAGTLLVGTEGGLFEWSPGGRIRHLTAGMDNMGIATILRHPSRDYWLATASGLFRMRLVGPSRTPEFCGGWVSKPDYPRGMILRRDGGLWATTLNSVVEFRLDSAGNARIVRRIGADDGLPANVFDLAEDTAGGLWVSTAGEGVAHIEDSGFVSYTGADGLGSASIASLFEDRTGRLCVMTSWQNKGDLGIFRNGRFQQAHVPHRGHPVGHSSGWNQFGLQARDGEWWFPGAGVLRFAATTAEELSHAPPKRWYHRGAGLACDEVDRVFEDSRGNIWIDCVALDVGFHPAVRDPAGDSFRSFTAADGWPSGRAATVFRELAPGSLWIGTNSGVVRFREGRFEAVPLSQTEVTPFVRDLFIDSARRVWVATSGQGLFRCDQPDAAHPRFVNYTPRQGLASLYIRALTEDRDGFLYAASVRGVDRIDPRTPLEAGRIHHFTPGDGLPNSEQNVAFTTRDGHLWFGTLEGLAEFDPARAPRPSPPEVYFTRVSVRGEEVPIPWNGTRYASFALAPNRNQLQIEFVGSSLPSEADLRYQYRLAGVQEEWSEPSPELHVNYPALPAGKLRFEVRAVNSDGQFSASPAALDLQVAAPVWQRAWFLLLVALAVTALATAAYRYRVDQLLAMERLRTRIATDLHDDMGASLSQISILSELAGKGAAPQVFSDIAEIARGMVADLSDIVWAVSPKHDRLDGLVHRMRRFAGDTLGGSNIDLNFETARLAGDSAVPLEIRRPLYLVFKEAVNNVARHSGGTTATIHLEQDGPSLRLTVEDNGRGFDIRQQYEGQGLASIARRMRDIGGSAAWDSEPGRGTKFTAILPLRTGGALHELGGRPGRTAG